MSGSYLNGCLTFVAFKLNYLKSFPSLSFYQAYSLSSSHSLERERTIFIEKKGAPGNYLFPSNKTFSPCCFEILTLIYQTHAICNAMHMYNKQS